MPKFLKKENASKSPCLTEKKTLGARCVWTPEEDELLHELIQEHGIKKWTVICEEMKLKGGFTGKSGKQCRERWHNHLNPNIDRSTWTPPEEKIFFIMHSQMGNKWSEIAAKLPGRTHNSIKNYFYCRLRKMVRKINKGIISEEQKSTTQQLKESLYVINHLNVHYVQCSANQRKLQMKNKGDSYISDIVEKNNIEPKKVARYTKDLLNSAQKKIRNALPNLYPQFPPTEGTSEEELTNSHSNDPLDHHDLQLPPFLPCKIILTFIYFIQNKLLISNLAPRYSNKAQISQNEGSFKEEIPVLELPHLPSLSSTQMNSDISICALLTVAPELKFLGIGKSLDLPFPSNMMKPQFVPQTQQLQKPTLYFPSKRPEIEGKFLASLKPNNSSPNWTLHQNVVSTLTASELLPF